MKHVKDIDQSGAAAAGIFDIMVRCHAPTEGRVHPFNRGGLFFSRGGASRLAAITGWLSGLERPKREQIACKLEAQLLTLDRWGGTLDANYHDRQNGPQTEKVPSTCVELGDDGTLHGFTVLWYGLMPHVDAKRWLSEKMVHDGYEYNDGARTERRFLAYPELENPMKCHEYYERGRMLIPTQLYLTHGYYFTMNGGMLWDKNREEWGRHT